MNAVEVTGISKSYGNKTAIKSLSFSVKEGEIFGFIGPDGAGKTTIFRILTTLILPDSGNATVLGKDVIKDYKYLREHLGYMPGRFSLYQDLTVEENLRFFASIFDTTIKDNYDLIKDIYSQIEPFKKRRAGKLSGGMKQKLALSCALIHKPSLLVLDEPTTGVDAVSRKEFWEMLKRLKQQGITIIVSTPYMDEADLCDRVALIQNGSILEINTPENVVKKYAKTLFAIICDNKYQTLKAFEMYQFTDSVYPFGDSIHYTDKRVNISSEELISYLKENISESFEIRQINPGIEDMFMALMKDNKNV
jgi:ABC-2 type transport system ATP-binding protein